MKQGEWLPHHIKNWMKYKDDEAFLFLRYEDMKRVSQGVIYRIIRCLSPEEESMRNKILEKIDD